jgi:cell division protein FtsI (penicillin-binding protein 3)
VDADSICVDPSQLGDRSTAARAIGRALNLDRERTARLRKTLEERRAFAWIKRQAEADEADKVRRLDLPGVRFVKESRRVYPRGALAGQVLGFVGVDGQGLDGLELALDEPLRGATQEVGSTRDARGVQAIAPGEAPPSHALAGATVELTLDASLQHAAEQALARAVHDADAAGGVVVALDPTTGELLALAVAPAFDPNKPARAPGARRNRAFTDGFEPGSTLKMFVVAGALEDKAIAPDELFFAENGAYDVGAHTIHDGQPNGWLDAAGILRVSSNIGAAKIAQRLGRERLLDALRRFGFGERTGVDLPGEVRGALRGPDKMPEIQLATIGFGQGIGTTALQLAAAAGAIANGGVLMRPFVVKRVVAPDGTVVRETQPATLRRAVSAAVASRTVRMLEGVVAPGGTGERAAIPGYRVAGKTGTAQKADPLTGGYSADKRVASFLGFAPASAPRLVVYVNIDEPKGEVYGGRIAAPVFKEIAESGLRLLGVAPDAPVAAGASLAAVGSTPTVKLPEAAAAGDGPAAPPPEGWLGPREADAPPGQAVVPALLGLDARAATRSLSAQQLEAELQGTGHVVSQTPLPGTVLPWGARVRLKLQPAGT